MNAGQAKFNDLLDDELDECLPGGLRRGNELSDLLFGCSSTRLNSYSPTSKCSTALKAEEGVRAKKGGGSGVPQLLRRGKMKMQV